MIQSRPGVRLFVFGLALFGCFLGADASETFNNPVTTNRTNPDPFVFKDASGCYYGLSTHEGHNNIVMFRGTNLLTLYRGEHRVVWPAPASGWNTRDIWAPELHLIDGKFYIYYSGGNGKKQNTGVLKCAGADPYNGTWTDAGRLFSPEADDWAIDGTVLQQNGNLYFIWSGETPDNMKIQKLFISKMSSPTALTGPRVEISRPTFSFERHGNPKIIEDVNEGPEILQHGDRTFLIYSCSFCGTHYYNLGMLRCDADADPMVPAHWTKSTVSVFHEANGLFGPGHCSFTKSPDGREDWLVYHAMLNDRNDQPRYVCMQPFTWNKNGTPDFGEPRKTGVPAPK